LQFNAYHKYTVDEHTFVVLERMESFRQRDDVIGRAYAAVVRKDVLHLAVLLHDLGKGYEEDHSEVGKRLATQAADRLRLSADDQQTLEFLVHRHLVLSNTAMKRDLSDPNTWIHLAREVGNSQRLRMLYVLTCADVMGVGPGVFSPWTADLLEELYRNTLAVLGDPQDARDSTEIWDQRRRSLLDKHHGDETLRRLIAGLPYGYLADVADDEIEEHLRLAAALPAGDVDVVTKYRPETTTATYTIITSESIADFPFSKICGGLAAHHLDVLRARIYTLEGGMVIDQFDVRDTHCFGEPSPERVRKVESTLRRILRGELSVQDALYSSRSSMFAYQSRVMANVDTCVTIDNECSEQCTVIDVFTNNRRGLLYTLAQGIARLGLSVQHAKIATYEDEAADVFYVQEQDGTKVQQAVRIRMIQEKLAADVRRLAEDPRAMGF
jgi:[protein-PII] uridylyltransferase